jgi:hypothetical protein
VATYATETPTRLRPALGRPRGVAEIGVRRSHAAIPVAVALVLVGLYLAQYSLIAPGSLGVILLLSGGSFLSTRLNPLSPHFYLTRKPSWTAIGVVFLGAFALLGTTYALWMAHGGPIVALP